MHRLHKTDNEDNGEKQFDNSIFFTTKKSCNYHRIKTRNLTIINPPKTL